MRPVADAVSDVSIGGDDDFADVKLPTIGGKYFALAVLFVMNPLNYVDRYAFFAVGSPIQKDLNIDDYWFGWLGASFMIVYTACRAVHGLAG